MKKAVYLFLSVLLVGCLTLTHLSCSSSGGDDGGGGGGGSTPAASDQQTLDEDSVTGALAFIEDNVPGCEMDDTTAAAQKKATVRTILGLAGNITDNIVVIRSAQSTRTAAETISESIPGTCTTNPGELVINLTQNETTGAISGSIVFNTFCAEVEDGEGGTETFQANGTVNISGSTDTTTGDLESLSISTGTGGILVQTGADTITADIGSLSVSVSGSTTTVTMDSLSVSADVDGEETDITVEDLDVTVTEYTSTTEVEASVTYVDEDDGYVDIALEDLVVTNEDGTVMDGVLTVEGANGTNIQITYQSATDDFLVEADTNGDGTYDYQPGCMDCSELDLEEMAGGFL